MGNYKIAQIFMKIKGIIFDCDGVLLDSEVIFCKCVINFLGKYKIQKNVEDVQFLIGQTNDKIEKDIKDCFLGNYECTTQDIQRELNEQYDKYYSIENLMPFDGLQNFVNYCYEKGLKIIIASSADRTYIDKVTRHFMINDKLFAVISGNDVSNGKPDPEIYNKAINISGFSKKDLIVIEDSVNGIKAAKAANLFTIGFKGSKILQDTKNADIEFNNYEEILKWMILMEE